MQFSGPDDPLIETCLAPFSSIVLEPSGGVSVCRHKGLRHKIGDLREETLREIWNGPRIREWRRDFLEGRRAICRDESRFRLCNVGSHNAKFAPEVVFEEVQPFPPLRVGLNLNGTCNLQCPMCEVWKQPAGFYRQPHIWKQVEEILPYVREIEMLGGEPFLQADVYRVMRLVAKLNPRCRWNITTNATWKLTDYVREQLDPLPFRTLIISTDSLDPEAYERLRPPAKLDRFLANVDALSAYSAERAREGRPPFPLITNCTIQKGNWREIPELARFGLGHGNIRPNLSLLYLPHHLSLLDEPADERVRILRYLLERLAPSELPLAGCVFRPLLESLPPLTRAELVTELSEARGRGADKPETARRPSASRARA